MELCGLFHAHMPVKIHSIQPISTSTFDFPISIIASFDFIYLQRLDLRLSEHDPNQKFHFDFQSQKLNS